MENKTIKFNSLISNYEVVNPEFARVKVYVCYEGKNRNRSEIPRNVLEEMSKTIYGIPVVAEYDKDNNCFKGHGGKLEITDEGIDYINTTVPYGFVDPKTPVFYEKVRELDGVTENDYLCCYAYLWYKRYPEVESVLRNQDGKKIGQSMEIEVDDYEYTDDGYCMIKKGHFSALAMLGVEPCFESAMVTSKFSKDDIEGEYKDMLQAFKKYTLENFEEGGNDSMQDENKEFENNNLNEEVEEVSTEDFAEKDKDLDQETEDKEDEIEEDSDDEDEKEDMAKKKKCSNEEETVDYEAKFNELEITLNNLKADYTTLQTEKIALEEENTILREYKSNIENAEYQASIDNVMDRFAELKNVDGFEVIENAKYEFTVEELETKLKVFAFDNNVVLGKKKNFTKEVSKTLVIDRNETQSTSNSHWDLLDKYNSK